MGGVGVNFGSCIDAEVVKTRVQSAVETVSSEAERRPLLENEAGKKVSTWRIAVQTYREGGVRLFFRGLGVCSIRAFVVNAVQFAVYEYCMNMMIKESQGKIPAAVQI